ncbi:MAG: patatin-like phospholipase family protein [Cyclobacteriaceae bacterium]|nr:patatin-like phospholipase family protein [Cyclobacteriaceae bacterium]
MKTLSAEQRKQLGPVLSLFKIVIDSIFKFLRSSFLSLLFILLMLLLLTQMKQAYTMLVVMIESQPWSLLISLLMVSALAITISHYPIYVYYALNLNESGDYVDWDAQHYWIGKWRVPWITVFCYKVRYWEGYSIDLISYALRYSLGVFVHGLWLYFIFFTFRPHFIHGGLPYMLLGWAIPLAILGACAIFIIPKVKLQQIDADGNRTKFLQDSRRILKSYAYLFIFTSIVGTLLLFIVPFAIHFNLWGYFILCITSVFMLLNYALFRLLRTSFIELQQVSAFYKMLSFFEEHKYYLLLFIASFIFSTAAVVYSNIASIEGGPLLNGIPILFIYFLCYYFILANGVKYFFAARKKHEYLKIFRKWVVAAIALVIVIAIASLVPFEKTVHQLEFEENHHQGINEEQFVNSVGSKSDTIFYIASHGGGLKANVWTLLVLNELQSRTKGRLLDQTVALSGASGGSLGLALYTGLYGFYEKDTSLIYQKIRRLALDDYASSDLVLTFGLDTYRKSLLLNWIQKIQDRPYYSMLKYQNKIEPQLSNTLSTTTFRDYWNQVYQVNGFCPSLIMNTAATTGKRGILWSVESENFHSIFQFADNLADLQNNQTLSFYQAVSTTNRFPVFSPAAKIKGYGHFMDAGAIDNSGLLGCLDLHNYLTDQDTLKGKHVVFLEIVNAKTLYIESLIQQYLEQNPQLDLIPKNEKENDNILVNLETGLNLDKFPGYLNVFLKNTSLHRDSIHYVRLVLPHKVTIKEVSSYIDGVVDPSVKPDLTAFLKSKNLALEQALLEGTELSSWDFYEPVLSRHLSQSTFRYMRGILRHPDLDVQLRRVQSLIPPKR